MPNKYGNISEIAQYNLENGTHFWRQDQMDADIAKRKRLQQSQQIYDSTDPFSIGDDVRAAYIYAGKRPETTEDQDRIDQFDKDAKVTNLAGLGAIATLPLIGEFTTYGPLVGALRIGAGTAGSAAGSWTLGKAGDFADKKLGTNWIGDTGRLLGGFTGFGAGMKTTTPLIRSAATRGLTLHMPQDTFMKVRGEGFDRAFNKVNTQSFPLENKTIAIPLKQTRVVSEGTYPLYTGPKHSVTEVVNPDGTVNPRAALRIEREVADNIPGAYRMESRLENPEWHANDPNTWAHTRNVAQSAWTVPTPNGLTKQDQMITALGHDFGKMVSGDGHAQSSAALIEQIFPDITEQQLTAISEHMGTPKSILGKVTKQADILNGKPAITRFVGDNGKIRLRLPSHTAEKPRELVLDPQGNNKFRVHTRTWDGDHIPAEMSGEDKNTLFNALYEELPEEAEILFPESGPGNYATRGTVAGLQRLARDSRFKPTGNGVLQYVDKDGSIKTFEGTGFKKPKPIKLISRPISEAEKLGIPKGERSNPKALEDPQYWGYKQWNDRYNAAVESGDWDEAQRLRDLHFKTKAPDTKVVDDNGNPLHMYHGIKPKYKRIGTRVPGSNYFEDQIYWRKPVRFTKFRYINFDLEDLAKESKRNWVSMKKAVPNHDTMNGYHTRSYETALMTYGRNNPSNVLDNYLNIEKPFKWDAQTLRNITGRSEASDWADFGWDRKKLMELGYDGLFIPQYHDSYGIFNSPAQIKSADPITWNGKGEIIPIVKRDNFHDLDMRYKQGGILKAQKGIPNNGLPPWIKRDDSTRTYITAFKPGDKNGRTLLRNWQRGDGKQLIRDSSLVKRIGNDGRYIYIPRSLAGGMSGGFHISELTGENKDSDEFIGRLRFVGMTEDGLYEYYDPLTGQNELYDTQFENGGKIHIKSK